MSLYKHRPWAPGYAVPGYVDAEPRGRGTFTTAQLRRRTISEPPKGWTGGYALPPNVEDEPDGQGTITTQQIKRRTISQFVPDFLLQRAPGDSLAMAQTGRSGFPGGDIPGMSGLGATELDIKPVLMPGFPGNPIAAYGREVAAYIMKNIRGVKSADRLKELRSLFDQIDGELWTTVAQKASSLEQQGMSARDALQRALAASLADGFARELVQIGLTGQMPSRGQTSVAAFGCAQAMGSFWSSVKNFAKDTGNFLERVGCRTLNSDAAPMAAAIAGQAAGVPAPVGAAGATLARDAAGCGGGAKPSAPAQSAPAAQPMQAITSFRPGGFAPPPAAYYPPPAAGLPILPIALGGAALLAVYLMRRK